MFWKVLLQSDRLSLQNNDTILKAAFLKGVTLFCSGHTAVIDIRQADRKTKICLQVSHCNSKAATLEAQELSHRAEFTGTQIPSLCSNYPLLYWYFKYFKCPDLSQISLGLGMNERSHLELSLSELPRQKGIFWISTHSQIYENISIGALPAFSFNLSLITILIKQ